MTRQTARRKRRREREKKSHRTGKRLVLSAHWFATIRLIIVHLFPVPYSVNSYPVRYSVVYRDRKRLGRKEGARCINTVQTARPQRDTAVAEMNFCWAQAMHSSAGNCAAETDERNGVLKKDASSGWSCCVHFPHPFSFLLYFFFKSPSIWPKLCTAFFIDKKFSISFFFLLQRWLCCAPTLSISGWVHSALVNILSCCTHQLTLPVGGRVASRGEACVYSFLFVCMCMWCPLRWCILFWSQLFFQSYLPQFVLYLCVCVDYVMFFCHFYSLFGGWLSEGYFSGKYVKKEQRRQRRKKKKRKTNHRASWLMPFCLRMLYISIVLSSLFFFYEFFVFSSLTSVCGTIVTRRWEQWCGVVLSLAYHVSVSAR